MPPTIAAPDSGTPELSPYDALGTHLTRYAAQDVARIQSELESAVALMPDVFTAFRQNDPEFFSQRMVDIEIRVRHALTKATWVLQTLKGE